MRIGMVGLRSVRETFRLNFNPFMANVLRPRFHNSGRFIANSATLFRYISSLSFVLVENNNIGRSVATIGDIGSHSFTFNNVNRLGCAGTRRKRFGAIIRFCFLRNIVLPLSFVEDVAWERRLS